MAELWHAAGRAAGDPAKRRVALLGILMSAPALLLGAILSHLVTGHGFEGLSRPLHYILAPATRAHAAGADVALLGYVTLQGLLLAIVWSFYGGALHRLAAVDLTQGRRDPTSSAFAFAARHARGFVGAKATLLLGAALPLALAVLVSAGGRLDGWLGTLLLTLAMVLALVLAFLAVFLLMSWLVGGFLTTPVIACEDSDSFDALSRAFGYAGAGVPRLTLWRLAFLGGVLLGTTWRAARVIFVILLAVVCVRLGAGAERLENVERILKAMGTPPGAGRLDLSWADYLAAVVAGTALFLLLATWLADLIARVVCARTAVYLGLREAIDRIPRSHLATPPATPGFADAETAGFEEVGRIEDA